MHSRCAFLILGTVLALASSSALAEPPACKGKLSGSVQSEFACVVRLATNDEGKLVFSLVPTSTIEDVPVYQPGSFEIPGQPAARTYTFDELGLGIASVAREGGTLFTASKTSSRRGEVTLVLRTVKLDPASRGSYLVHGTYRARLLPAGAGKTGEVIVEASF